MPYYVYRIDVPKRLSYVEHFDNYRDARGLARTRRAQLRPGEEAAFRVIFAPTQQQAERLLLTPRTPRPLGEDA